MNEVYASACQYHVGKYLHDSVSDQRIIVGMMGKNYGPDAICVLDNMVPEMIKLHSDSNTVIHLFYSKLESTYEDHIVDLELDLTKNSIHYTVTTDDYTRHGDNGLFFSKHLKEKFCQ